LPQGGLSQFHIKVLSSGARLWLLNVLSVRLRRLKPRRLDIILDLEPALSVVSDVHIRLKSIPDFILPY
jgi:hypothetical protein